MHVTRADVARMAGVSTATVSNVLNSSGKVKKSTAEKVMKAVRALDYSPDMIARSMSTKRSMQLGIVLESLSNPFFGDIVKGFENAANQKDYFVNICTGFNKLDEYFDNFITRRVDGVFVAALPYKFNMDRIYNLVDKGIKVIVSGNVGADLEKVSSIENDYCKAMKEIMQYLYELGHTRIAYLAGFRKNMPYDLRIKGYLDMVRELDLPCGEDLLIEGNYPYTTGMQDGYEYARDIIASGKKFTAVICVNDLVALGAIKALKENGYKVPEDVSVVGFDGIEFGKYWEPELTTMSLDKIRFGEKAFEILYGDMAGKGTASYELAVELIVRKSTARCRE